MAFSLSNHGEPSILAYPPVLGLPRKAPVNFGGVLIFVDGERFPEDSLQEARGSDEAPMLRKVGC